MGGDSGSWWYGWNSGGESQSYLQRSMRVQGQITADSGILNSLEVNGTLNVNSTGKILAAPSGAGTSNQAALTQDGFATVNDLGIQTTALNSDGSGQLGSGANVISWTTGGVLTVPAAIIGNLTIASVGAGVVGGAYATAGGTGARVIFSTSGITAYNSSNTQTFLLDSSTGDVTITGTFSLNGPTGSTTNVFIDQNEIVLSSTTGNFGDVIKWDNATQVVGSIYSTNSPLALVMAQGTSGTSLGATLTLESGAWVLAAPSAASIFAYGNNIQFSGALYPGQASTYGTQTAVSIGVDSGNTIKITASQIEFVGNNTFPFLTVSGSTGTQGTFPPTATLPAGVGGIEMAINGTVMVMPFYHL